MTIGWKGARHYQTETWYQFMNSLTVILVEDVEWHDFLKSAILAQISSLFCLLNCLILFKPETNSFFSSRMFLPARFYCHYCYYFYYHHNVGIILDDFNKYFMNKTIRHYTNLIIINILTYVLKLIILFMCFIIISKM